ncbi:MAG: hypothetical protein ACRDJX_00880 [Solirubrobacteraceae bacterium]
MRRLAIILAASAALAALPAADAAAGSHAVTSCAYIHASTPYTTSGHADRWRVYIDGSTSCASAAAVLDAVMHRHGRQHVAGSEAGSYTTFAGWICPYGLMGEQSCELPARPPARAPIRAHALALNCARPGEGCPGHVPSSEL